MTRGGRAGVYSGDLQLLNTYEVSLHLGDKQCYFVARLLYSSHSDFVTGVPAASGHAATRQELLGDRRRLHER